VGATPQIADWLAKLGMTEYAERFAENGIDGIDISVLNDLTDQDLWLAVSGPIKRWG